jgi:hypothetical protein
MTVQKSEAGLPTSPVTLESRSPWLLGRCSRQLRKSSAGAKMVYSRAGCVFIIEHYFASKSFSSVRDAFSNAYSDKEELKLNTEQIVPNTDPETLGKVS